MSGSRGAVALPLLGAFLGVLVFVVVDHNETSTPPAPPTPSASPPVVWGTPTPVPGPVSAIRLTTAEPVDTPGYTRAEFGYDWLDLDSDGCNTREEVMARDLVALDRPDGCNVAAGVLNPDPYTGTRVVYDETVSYLSVQVDHVYPLHLAWDQGAAGWDDTKRRAFANDPRNLLAVDGPTNASKGDSGPGEWMPPNSGYACPYARQYVSVARSYALPVSAADAQVLRATIADCNTTRSTQ